MTEVTPKPLTRKEVLRRQLVIAKQLRYQLRKQIRNAAKEVTK